MIRSVFALAALTAIVGCNDRPYRLAPVSGTITLDGEPLAGVVINLQPMAGGGDAPGPGSTGKCDADGRYTVETLHGEPGAVVGKHRVRIYGPKAEAIPQSDVDTPGVQEIIPAKYNYESQLTLDVPESGAEASDYALSSE